MTDEQIVFGVYTCEICSKRYTVNVPHTYDPCTPTQCHECHKAYRLGVASERKRCVEVLKRLNAKEFSAFSSSAYQGRRYIEAIERGEDA